LPMDEVRAVLKKQFESVFGIQFFQKRPEDLNSILQ
jgi:hypothetical protein